MAGNELITAALDRAHSLPMSQWEDLFMFTKAGLVAGTIALAMVPCASSAQVQMQRDITWKLGLAIAQGAIEECAKNNVAISVAVVDRAGRVRIFIASDNPSPHNFELARRKAHVPPAIARMGAADQ